jgi:hypothetical protein
MVDDLDEFALAERAGELHRNMRGLDSGMRDITAAPPSSGGRCRLRSRRAFPAAAASTMC